MPNWAAEEQPSTFFSIKSYAENILKRLGFRVEQMFISESENDIFSEGLRYELNHKTILETGVVSKVILKKTDIDAPVYYADFDWGQIVAERKKHKVLFEELPKFPSVRRDLALLVDREIKFSQIRNIALKTERQILREVNLFDVYDGKGIPQGKKSYAVSFLLRDDQRTLNDKQIDKTIQRLTEAFARELGAQLR